MQDITNFLYERKSEYQKRCNRAYEQEKQARKLLEDEPDREDVKSDLSYVVKLQDRYNSLVEFINELVDVMAGMNYTEKILTNYIIDKIHSCPFEDDCGIDFEKECVGFGEPGCMECILRNIEKLEVV